MSRLVLSLLLVAALLASGCGADGLECKNASPGQIEVGLGDLNTGFLSISDGDDALVVLGSQGLHMILVSARVTDFEAPSAGPSHVTVAIQSQEQVVGGAVAEMNPVVNVDAEFLGMRAAFVVQDVTPLVGTLVTVDVTVSDGCGRELQGRRTVRLIL